jgi:histidinol dehydrogenase
MKICFSQPMYTRFNSYAAELLDIQANSPSKFIDALRNKGAE